MEKKFVYEKPQLVEYPYFGKIVASGAGESLPPTENVPGAGTCSDTFDE